MTLIKNVLRLFSLALIGSYALSNLLFLILRFFVDEQDYLMIAFINSFVQVFWLPAVLLLPLCLLFRQKRLVLMLLPTASIFLWSYGGQFIAETQPAAQLTVLSYNALAINTQQAAIIDFLAASDADIIALQEVSIATADAIRRDLTERYPYQALHPLDNPYQGQGILSRYPILEDSYWQYDWLKHNLGHQRVVIQVAESTPLVVYNSHPTHPGMQGAFFNPRYRYCEVADVLGRTLAESERVLWLGDFNFQDTSSDYDLLRPYYRDSFKEVGWGLGWTFPVHHAFAPLLLRLDYVWYGEGLVAKTAEVGTTSMGSDHYPLTVTLDIMPFDGYGERPPLTMSARCQDLTTQ